MIGSIAQLDWWNYFIEKESSDVRVLKYTHNYLPSLKRSHLEDMLLAYESSPTPNKLTKETQSVLTGSHLMR
jgi:hypothetical protein